MREREEPSFFDSVEDYNRKRAQNRQVSYENKVCRKLVMRLFERGNPDREAWLAQLEASSEPLVVLQDLLGRFCLSAHRLQSWSINELLGPPSKLANLPLWKEFSERVAECAKYYPDKIPAMAFYNSVIAQDMVIHTGIDTTLPNGYFRLMRSSTSGDGGVVIDTLDGFLEMIAGS